MVMSDLLTGAQGEVYGPREVHLTDELTVLRVLPQRPRRRVGAWCFLDHYRADDSQPTGAMNVLPHPHIGLQTVTWLFSGAVRHRDSLGNDQHITPGELNVMTAGSGLSHAETSLPNGMLHGLQFWIALPNGQRGTTPTFEHHADLPVVDLGNATARLIIGSMNGYTSPATVFSPLMGVELTAAHDCIVRVPLDRTFEHGVLAIDGAVDVDGVPVSDANLYYAGLDRDSVDVRMRDGSRAFIFGGAPLDEPVLLWWNFAARTHDEMVAAREEWEHGTRFGTVAGFNGQRIPAPPIAGQLRS
jgi:redox-sensitive bicupin YhaK (pirin superfamily)